MADDDFEKFREEVLAEQRQTRLEMARLREEVGRPPTARERRVEARRKLTEGRRDPAEALAARKRARSTDDPPGAIRKGGDDDAA